MEPDEDCIPTPVLTLSNEVSWCLRIYGKASHALYRGGFILGSLWHVFLEFLDHIWNGVRGGEAGATGAFMATATELHCDIDDTDPI